jgi:ABC-type Fe3+/spermidine/putrescine transport system ATPase subunit/ABC-type sulfate transport system permease component
VRQPPAILTVLAGLLALYLIAPFAAGLAQIGIADWSSADLRGLASACAVSIASATLAAVLVALGGIPLGYLLARRPGRGMSLLGFVVQLPLALPPLASGVLLLFLLGYSSPLGRLTNGTLTDSFTGITLAEAFVAAPFLIIAARSAFAGIDPVLEDVAATLGHAPRTIFLWLNLPLAGRAILAGLLLAWLRAFGEFGATVMVAYHPYSLPVFTYVAFGGGGLPAMIPVMVPTLVAAIAVMLASQLLDAAASKRMLRRTAGTAVADRLDVAEARSAQAWSTRAATEPSLDLAFRRCLAGFELNVAWCTNARRLAILGASGSGKSMTLRLIAGLDDAEAHSLYLNGRDLSNKAPQMRGIAYVPQSYGLFPHLPVERQIRFSVGSDPAAADHWTNRLGLRGLEHRLPSELSLGQQQRVALARALARKADLLLFDEPFSALDAPLRARLRQEFCNLQREFDTTTVLVTHDPAEAILLADDLLLLDAGHVLQSGPVESLFLRPANEAVARLLGAQDIAYGRAVASNGIEVGQGVELAVAGPALQTGRKVGWAVRPERIRFAPDGPYPAHIIEIGEVQAGARDLTLQLGDALLHMRTDPAFGAEKSCRVAIDPQAVQVWTVG